MTRIPIASGRFYPGEPGPLRSMIKGMLDENAVKEDVVGLVSPHAGYLFSGPVAGAVISRVNLSDTVIIIGPNHTGQGKPLSIMTEGTWKTPLGEIKIDTRLGRKIIATSRYLKEDSRAHQKEHSIEVQLPFLQYFQPSIKMVPIILGYVDGAVYKEIGKEIARALKELGKKVVIIASSDMTHYEPQESAQRKDNQAIAAILSMNEDELLKRVHELDISMCGLAPVISLLSAAKQLGASRAELVKYQTSGDTNGDYSSVVGYAGIIIKEMSSITRLAKETVETYIKTGKITQIAEPPPEMKGQSGVFVSIHKQGALRGCIGTFEPTEDNVAREIITNAISAATHDPRFSPIKAGELEDLDYSVDVLTKPEPITDETSLNTKKFGAIVQSGWRRGLLLPDLEGVDAVDDQIAICRQKAGICPDEPIKLYRFEVKRYK